MTSLGLRSGLRPGKTTSKLLEKVSKQLRGDYAGKGAGASDDDINGEDDDDGVSSYLKMLSQKTAKQTERTEASNAGDDSDGEASKATPVKSTATVSANRFLKKPSTPAAAAAAGKPASTVNSAKMESNKGRGKAADQSPTLHRVEAFTKKYGRSGKIAEPEPTSDSDLNLSLSLDEDILADVKELKKNRPASSVDSVASVKSPAAKTLPKNAKKSPKNNDEEDSGSMKIGRSGNRFLKTPISIPDGKDPEIASQEMKKVESPAKGKQRSSLFKLESAARHSTEVVLDTDEESLAEFIGGLSGGSSGRRTPSRTKSKESMKSGSDTKPKDNETDGDHVDRSISEADPDSFKFNVLDLASLQDMTKTTTETHKNSRSVTPQKSKAANQFKSAKGRDVRERSASVGRKKEQADDVLSQFGLHSVDDLLGTTKDDYVEPLPISEVLYESDFDFVPYTARGGISPMPLRSILSPTPRSMTPRSSRSRVRLMDELTEIRSRSPSPETPKSASRTTRSETVRTVTDSESEIERTIRTIDESNAKGNTSEDSDTEETSTVKTLSDGDSVTSSFDRMSVVRRSRRRIQRRDSSSRRSSTASERFYSDDFTNTSPGSESTSRRSSFTDDDPDSQSSMPSTDSKDRSRRKVKTRDSEVQTGLDVGLHYHWVNDVVPEAWASAQYKQAFADPARVSTSVVSAEALDVDKRLSQRFGELWEAIHALTNFSPAMLALNDMLRQQLQLTTQFMTVHRRLHYGLIHSIDSSAYKYTTLKETKEFIRKHSRPVASFEETLEQVKQEMGIV